MFGCKLPVILARSGGALTNNSAEYLCEWPVESRVAAAQARLRTAGREEASSEGTGAQSGPWHLVNGKYGLIVKNECFLLFPELC